MIKTNLECLVEAAVSGSIGHPRAGERTVSIGFDGKPAANVCQSGLLFNVKVGDRAVNWAWGDHVMPGVTVRNEDVESNRALRILSCIGNEATIVDAAFDGKDMKLKGVTGTVVGKNAIGVMIYLQKKVVDKLCIGDRIQIKATGQGLKLGDHANIAVMNCSPQLFKAINPTEKSGRVRVPVTTILPGKLMGSGIGEEDGYRRTCDIQATSPEIIKEYKLENIRLGDLVAIADYDCTHGPRWQDGAISVGTVAYGSSARSGHGPGINVLFASGEGLIEPVITRRANIADLLNLT